MEFLQGQILYMECPFGHLYTLEHYFRDVFRVQISSDEHSLCNILLPLSSFGLLNISEWHLVILLKFHGVLYAPTTILWVYP